MKTGKWWKPNKVCSRRDTRRKTQTRSQISMCKLTLFYASSYFLHQAEKKEYSLFLHIMYIGNMDQIMKHSFTYCNCAHLIEKSSSGEKYQPWTIRQNGFVANGKNVLCSRILECSQVIAHYYNMVCPQLSPEKLLSGISC